MRILVIGGGGREHALSWRLARDSGVSAVLCAPGNPGIGGVARTVPVDGAAIDDLVALARAESVDLTVVGPEVPLAAGLVDRFTVEGLLACGPTRDAARLETSKAFAKAFMARHGVPTARFETCASPDQARRAVDAFGCPVVLKADGLAAGKGVVVAPDRATAFEAIDAAMVTRQFGTAGDLVVVEEFLSGTEASYFVLCDGRRALPLGSAQDHKRVYDNDEGPNTGGMGAFAPSPRIDAAVEAQVLSRVVEPTLAGLAAEGSPYRGFLYVGLMLTGDGPKVIEYNVRFGDPEAQVVLPMLDGELAPLLAAAARGALPARTGLSAGVPHVGVVLASGGYPGKYSTGVPIDGLDAAAAMEDVIVFHAGTAMRDGRLVTAGGRVLTVVGRGATFERAIERAYAAATTIRFEGRHMRMDIGSKALNAALNRQCL